MSGTTRPQARPGRAALAGVVAGLVACVPVVAALDGGAEAPPTPTTATIAGDLPVVDPATAEAFVTAWAASRRVTFAATQTVERVAGATRVVATGRVAQLPPRRLVVAGEGATLRTDTERTTCSVAEGGDTVCATEAVPLGFEAEIARDVGRLRRLFEDSPQSLAWYGVARRGDCFVLGLRLSIAAPPYGEEAAFCFDAGGVLVRVDVDFGRVRQVTELREVRETVTDEDLRLPSALPEPEPAPVQQLQGDV